MRTRRPKRSRRCRLYVSFRDLSLVQAIIVLVEIMKPSSALGWNVNSHCIRNFGVLYNDILNKQDEGREDGRKGKVDIWSSCGRARQSQILHSRFEFRHLCLCFAILFSHFLRNREGVR